MRWCSVTVKSETSENSSDFTDVADTAGKNIISHCLALRKNYEVSIEKKY